MVSISLGTSTKLDKSGGTLTGPLILERDPLGDMEAATRQFVLAHAGGGGGSVSSVNEKTPDGSGNITLAASDVGAIAATAFGAASGVATLDGSGHLTAGQAALLLAAADNLAALADKPTARTNLGLGSAATQNSGAFDAAGAASAALAAAEANAATLYLPLAGGTLTGPLALGGHKVTGVANGTAGSDAAAFGQIPLVGAAGTGAGVALSSTDATTTNARTPTAHASTHASGAADALTPDAIGAVSCDWTGMLGVALLTATFTESAVTYQQTPGDLVLCLCTAPKTKTVSKLALWVTAAGVTGSGVNALALFDEAGNLIDQTGDMTTAWSSTGMPEGALGGSHIVTAGVGYYLGFLTHFSGTSPHLAATGTAQTANFPVANGHRTAIFKSGQLSVPSSIDPSSFTPNSGYFVMYAR